MYIPNIPINSFFETLPMDSRDTINADTQDSPLIAPPSRKKRKSRWPMVLIVLALAGGSIYYLNSEEATVADQPLVSTVEIGSIINTISSAGTVKPSNFVDVGAQVSGQLEVKFSQRSTPAPNRAASTLAVPPSRRRRPKSLRAVPP